MKKTLSAALLALLCGSGTAFAADNSEAPNVRKLSLGYEGILAGNVLQGVSTRYWFNNNVGGELNGYFGRLGINADNSSYDDSHVSLLMGSAKLLYAPVVKAHSRFYVGIEGGVGNVGVEVNDKDALPGVDVNVYTVSPLIGSEFYFAEMPELGLNWEVGYRFQSINVNSDSAGDVDLKLDGTFVTLGAHYYF